MKLNKLETKKLDIYFKDKYIFDGKWNAPEIFKLKFDNDNLVSIENIQYKNQTEN